MSISERIRFIRESQPNGKLSRREFAERLGVSPGVIQNAEEAESRLKNGKISELLLLNICSAYHVNYQWLTEGKEPMYTDTDPDSLVDRYAPDESEYFKAAARGMMNLSDVAWEKLRDFVEDMRAKLRNSNVSDEP